MTDTKVIEELMDAIDRHLDSLAYEYKAKNNHERRVASEAKALTAELVKICFQEAVAQAISDERARGGSNKCA